MIPIGAGQVAHTGGMQRLPIIELYSLMSYEISLYGREFLDRAIREQLGDWTRADSLPDISREMAVAFLQERGYTEQDYPWQSDCRTFQHPDFGQQVEVTIFDGCISFAIQYSENALESVNTAIASAKELGRLINLVVYDPQDGTIIDDDQ